MKRIIFILLLAGCKDQPPPPPQIQEPGPPLAVTIVETKPHIFTPEQDGRRLPKARLLDLSEFPRGSAIWGATGRDHRGTIYAGVSTEPGSGDSAHLMLWFPERDLALDLGSAFDKLKDLKLSKPGESQNKIHTKFVLGTDGKIYFASFDETGEKEDGSKPPTYGSHLWRKTPPHIEWEHLGHVPEGIIAAAAGDRFIYYLGYFNHILYQYDLSRNAIVNQIPVGSVGGHTTRNFIVDDRGHAFVPRVTATKAELVEFDEDLHEVKAFPLNGYSLTPDSSSHGIVGVEPLKDGGWLFTTDRGKLYRLDPRATGSTLTDLGFIHPDGECYAACLFSLDGESHAVAIGNRVVRGEPAYEWIRFDLKTKTSTASPLKLPTPDGAANVLAYGSFTRDDAGRCYVGGTYKLGEKNMPAMWCLEP